jgi:hypothetical protein
MKQIMLAIVITLPLCAATAFATQTAIDISAEANATWCGQSVINCSTFPSGSQSYDNVTFNIPTSNNAWFANVAAGGGSGQVSVTIPVNVKNVKTVYTLMNTFWGITQSGLLSVTFTGTNGATWTYNLTGGTDLRDYNQNGSTTNTISCQLPGLPKKTTGAIGTVGAWNNGQGQRLDMQIFALPKSFATQTLTSVTITDNGNAGLQRAFIAAMTVSTLAP